MFISEVCEFGSLAAARCRGGSEGPGGGSEIRGEAVDTPATCSRMGVVCPVSGPKCRGLKGRGSSCEWVDPPPSVANPMPICEMLAGGPMIEVKAGLVVGIVEALLY